PRVVRESPPGIGACGWPRGAARTGARSVWSGTWSDVGQRHSGIAMLQCAAFSRLLANSQNVSRESMAFGVVVVGAGPAGLATACRLGQLARAGGREISIGGVEKGAAIGSHNISGAVFDPRPLDELFPDWRAR